MFFAIAFVGRSGSSYLQGLLDSHPHIDCRGEIFAAVKFKQGGGDVGRYLDETLGDSVGSATGFKLGISHLKADPEIMGHLRRRRYRFIHLTRRNRIDQFISMRLAQINGIWRSDGGSYQVHSFAAEPQLVGASLKALIKDDADLLCRLEGLPTLTVTYEELVAPGGYRTTLEFLGVSDWMLESPFVRQRRAVRQRDALQNYDELAEYFKGTDMEQYFID